MPSENTTHGGHDARQDCVGVLCVKGELYLIGPFSFPTALAIGMEMRDGVFSGYTGNVE